MAAATIIAAAVTSTHANGITIAIVNRKHPPTLGHGMGIYGHRFGC